MSGTTVMRVRRLAPGEFDPGPDHRLAPDHPFLRTGTWRAFVAGDGPDETRVVASVDPRQRAEAGQVGAIGFVATRGDSGSPAVGEAMRSALAAAESWLAGIGAAVVRCPMQFSTWYGHRAMTGGFPEDGGPPPFAMEPFNGRVLPEILGSSGFHVVHTAASYVVPVDRWIEGATLGESRLRSAGFRDRPIRLDHLDDELQTIHAISSATFRRSWGFSDIALDEFRSIYRPLVRLADPDLIRFAESPDGRPVGFIFAFAEPSTRPGGRDARFVAKSVAVLPEVRQASPGIGIGLTVAVHRLAAARGYPTAIHACVADGAFTQRISARWGERFRTYATFEKALR
jgi:hypothetical protein